MKCKNCGYEIPAGELYCKRCGEEVRIVPDYNPLDDMLTQQIKVSINGDEPAGASDRMYTRTMKTTGRTTHISGNNQKRPFETADRRRDHSDPRGKDRVRFPRNVRPE